ncbi:MAG: 23S rRNA (guanosine(2251)-2'-O)-methyltransferase RlmB [Alphaproteobacteria bacterium]|nr:23S rRNA (guanosine(2251)-2'-O)-methyltransferase RlmB [Alphaproteobacteria bacterium]TAD87139.1 MAG: 23S rRNA (guanosine(2251)-2'-O)-methyltransferase RlmB [Alphaproteobacteria bacterium]
MTERPPKSPADRSASRRPSSRGPSSRSSGADAGPPRFHRSAPAPLDRRSIAAPGGLWLWGLHAVEAALANPKRQVLRLVMTADVARGFDGRRLAVSPEVVERVVIDRLVGPQAVHQGLAMLTQPLDQPALHDLLGVVDQRTRFLALDQVTDPHNVGAILRSAAAFGAAAVILPDRGAPAETAVLAKAASGAFERVPMVRVVNLARAMDDLKTAGVWCVGLDGTATTDIADALADQPTALVLGAEGAGLRRLTGERCDVLARLPTDPAFPSLNVSNAAAIALYAVAMRLR